jgi:hypothetical protein
MTETQKTTEAPKEPEKVLFSWKAQSRPFRKRSREFWVRTAVVASVLGFILFIIEGAMPVILLIAILFLFYILSTVEPEAIDYKITTYGVRVAENLNDWLFLTSFRFDQRLGSEIVIFETKGIMGGLELLINPKDKEKLKTELSKFIQEENIAPSNANRASDWISKHFIEH